LSIISTRNQILDIKSKLKQKDFWKINHNDDKRRDKQRRKFRFEETKTDEDLGASNYFSKLYGNVGDY
jgi:hypothetical protein